MGRVATFALVLSAALAAAGASSAKDVAVQHLTIFADRDDDDDDGVVDALAALPREAGAIDVVEPKGVAGLRPVESDVLRVTAGPSSGRSVPGLQGLRAGHAVVQASAARLEVDVVEVIALDGRGERVDLATSHASISRALPASLSAEVGGDALESDALR
jgi:hypothetical protein